MWCKKENISIKCYALIFIKLSRLLYTTSKGGDGCSADLFENNNIKSLKVSPLADKLASWRHRLQSVQCQCQCQCPDGIHYHNLQHHKAIWSWIAWWCWGEGGVDGRWLVGALRWVVCVLIEWLYGCVTGVWLMLAAAAATVCRWGGKLENLNYLPKRTLDLVQHLNSHAQDECAEPPPARWTAAAELLESCWRVEVLGS